MTSLMTSPGHKIGKKFEIDIFPSIFELQRRSKAQNVGNVHGYLSGIFSFRPVYTCGQKVCRELRMAAILKILKY